MSPLTVAKALNLYDFRMYRSGDDAEWTGGAIVLICCEVLPRRGADLEFRILHAYDSRQDTLKGAEIILDSEQWSDCAAPALFALVGVVPESHRSDLLVKIRDAIIVQRHFGIPIK